MKILKQLFLIPVIPIILLVSIYITYKIYQNSDSTEMYFFANNLDVESKEFKNSDLGKYIYKLKNILDPYLYALSTIAWLYIIF